MLPAGATLCTGLLGAQGEKERASTEQQKQVKRASSKVRFQGGANSLHQSSPEGVHFTQLRCEMSRLFLWLRSKKSDRRGDRKHSCEFTSISG
jgi:hypothetical protein